MESSSGTPIPNSATRSTYDNMFPAARVGPAGPIVPFSGPQNPGDGTGQMGSPQSGVKWCHQLPQLAKILIYKWGHHSSLLPKNY